MALAFLLVSAGGGCCIYGTMLWRELPKYTEAEIAASAELNLALDTNREGHGPAGTVTESESNLARRREVSQAEVRAEIEQERSAPRAWFVGGPVLMLLGLFRGWSARIHKR